MVKRRKWFGRTAFGSQSRSQKRRRRGPRRSTFERLEDRTLLANDVVVFYDNFSGYSSGACHGITAGDQGMPWGTLLQQWKLKDDGGSVDITANNSDGSQLPWGVPGENTESGPNHVIDLIGTPNAGTMYLDLEVPESIGGYFVSFWISSNQANDDALEEEGQQQDPDFEVIRVGRQMTIKWNDGQSESLLIAPNEGSWTHYVLGFPVDTGRAKQQLEFIGVPTDESRATVGGTHVSGCKGGIPYAAGDPLYGPLLDEVRLVLIDAVDDAVRLWENYEHSSYGIDVLSNDSAPIEIVSARMLQSSPNIPAEKRGTILDNNFFDGKVWWDSPGADPLSLNFNYLSAGEEAWEILEYTMAGIDGIQDTARVTITITGVNEAPAAADDAFLTFEDGSVEIDVLANDVDVDHLDTLAAVIVDSPNHGSVRLNSNGTLTYTPIPNYNGRDRFTYRANDGMADSDLATVSLTVIEVNDAPTGVNDTLTSVAEDSGPRMIAFSALLANDLKGPANENDQTLTITAVSAVVGGTTAISGTNVVFSPAPDFNGMATFLYTLQDNGMTNGGVDPLTGNAMVTIPVLPVDDVVADTATTDEDTPVDIDVLANDTFADPNRRVTSVTQGAHGSVAINLDGTVRYTPSADYYGEDNFTYTVTTSNPPNVETGTVHVTVLAVHELGGVVWEDMDGDGIQWQLDQPGGEQGIAGVWVHLYELLDEATRETRLVASAMTSDGSRDVDGDGTLEALGYYRFQGFPPGNYLVRFEKHGQYALTRPDVGDGAEADEWDSDADPRSGMTGVIRIAYGDDRYFVDAGMYRPGAIQAFGFEDMNGDGVWDAGDPPFPEIPIELVTPQGSVLATRTNGNGLAGFKDLAPGQYTVRENLVRLAATIHPTTQTEFPITLYSGDTAAWDRVSDSLMFGNLHLASIGGVVWEDLNADGHADNVGEPGGEPGMGSVEVRLTDVTGAIVARQTTGDGLSARRGSYHFTDLLPGQYFVEVVKPADDYHFSAPSATGRSDSIGLVSGTHASVDAGLFRPGALGDRVWRDDNNNGIQDPEELGIPQVTVSLRNILGQSQSTLTDEDGRYQFAGLTPGRYFVLFDLPAGYRFTKAKQGTNDNVDSDAHESGQTNIATLASNQTILTIDAGLCPIRAIPPPELREFSASLQFAWAAQAPPETMDIIRQAFAERGIDLNSLGTGLVARDGDEILASVTYINSGSSDIPSPVLRLCADHDGFEWLLPGDTEWLTGPSVQFLAIGAGPDPTVLRPREKKTVVIRLKLPQAAEDALDAAQASDTPLIETTSYTIELTSLGKEQDGLSPKQIDYAGLEKILGPGHMSSVRETVGATWTDYVDRLGGVYLQGAGGPIAVKPESEPLSLAAPAGLGIDAVKLTAILLWNAFPSSSDRDALTGKFLDFAAASSADEDKDQIITVRGLTPEDKLGPEGYDPEDSPGKRYVSETELLQYRIEFWNSEDAIADARDAIIVDWLNPQQFDVSTVVLTRLHLLGQDLPLEGDLFQGIQVDGVNKVCNQNGCDEGVSVKIRAGYEMRIPRFTGDVTNAFVWWFTTINPPLNPLRGFLPPYDANSDYGKGWVEFAVLPVAGLPSGTTLENQAFVEFDFAKDLKTHPAPKEGPWVNTLDSVPPSSRVLPLPAAFGLPEPDAVELPIRVSWTGSDDPRGSGIASYDIYVSDNGGPWTRWLERTQKTSDEFIGRRGHTYGFFSIATDNVGHRESPPNRADSVTVIKGLSLSVTPLPDGRYQIDVWNATPGGHVSFAYGTDRGTSVVGPSRVTLALADPVVSGQGIADSSGHATAIIQLPLHLADRIVYFQAFEQTPRPQVSALASHTPPPAAAPVNRFHNVAEPTDVNGDGQVSPLDAITVINTLNARGTLELEAEPAASLAYVDCNNDWRMTPLDVLLVVNKLNRDADRTVVSAGEGEFPLPVWFMPSESARTSRAVQETEAKMLAAPDSMPPRRSWPVHVEPATQRMPCKSTFWLEPEDLWATALELELCLDELVLDLPGRD